MAEDYVRLHITTGRDGVRVDFVGDRASLPEVLAALPEDVSVKLAQIKADAGTIDRSNSLRRDTAVSQHRLQFSLALICAVVAIVFVMVSCGGQKDGRNQNRASWIDGAGFFHSGV